LTSSAAFGSATEGRVGATSSSGGRPRRPHWRSRVGQAPARTAVAQARPVRMPRLAACPRGWPHLPAPRRLLTRICARSQHSVKKPFAPSEHANCGCGLTFHRTRVGLRAPKRPQKCSSRGPIWGPLYRGRGRCENRQHDSRLVGPEIGANSKPRQTSPRRLCALRWWAPSRRCSSALLTRIDSIRLQNRQRQVELALRGHPP
jgi:hypothetical protein